MTKDAIQEFGSEKPTNIIESRSEVVGAIPNAEEILANPHISGLSAEFQLTFDEDQTVSGWRCSSYNDIDPEVQESVLNLFIPTATIVDTLRRQMHGKDKTALSLQVEDRIVQSFETAPLKDEGDNRLPHTDGYVAFYLAAIGAPTLIWEADFNTEPSATRREKLDSILDQIVDRGLEPKEANSGDIQSLDKETVHMSPEGIPEFVGQRRTVVKIYPMPYQVIEKRIEDSGKGKVAA